MLYAGVPFTIGGETYIVPPISLGQLRNGTLTKIKQHDELVAQEKTFEAIILRGEIILEALYRNYPQFESDKLWSYLDVANIGPIWLTVLGASGFVPGEAQAVTQTVNGTSSPSTEASPPLTDGRTEK